MADEKSDYELELWNAKICPFGMRAWFTVLQKGIDKQLGDKFNLNWIDLNAKPKEFSEKYALALGHNPSSDGQVPLIGHKGTYVTESAVVAAYLDRAYSDETKYGPRLIPTNPADAAKVDLITSWVGGGLISPFYGLLSNKEDSEKESKINKLRKNLEILNNKLLSSNKEGGFYLNSKSPSLFEIIAYPILHRFECLEELTGVPSYSKWLNPKSNESKGLERLIDWYNTCNQLDSVKQMKQIATTSVLVDLYRSATKHVVLYNSPVCPFGQRAWFALITKNLKYQWINCSLQKDKKEDYFKLAYSKALGRVEGNEGQVPVIKHNRKFIAQSAAIVRYLDIVYDDESKYGKSFFPGKSDPFGQAAMEILVEFFGSNIVPAYYKILGNDDAENHKKLVSKLEGDLKVLNDRICEISDSGLLLKDDRISFFEIATFPFLWRMHILSMLSGDYASKNVAIDKYLENGNKDYSQYSRLQNWYTTLYNREETQRMLKESLEVRKTGLKELHDAYTEHYAKPLKK